MQDKSKQSVWATDRQTRRRSEWSEEGRGAADTACACDPNYRQRLQRRRRRVPSPAIALAINIAFDTGSNTAGDDDDAICAPRSGTSKGANRGTPLFPLYYEGAKVRRLIPYCVWEWESKWWRWNAMFGTTRDARSDDSSLQRRTDAVLKC